MVDETVAASVRKYLGALEETGINARCGVVFGSQAKSCSDDWSDIDLLVISPLFDAGCTREQINTLWRTAARTDSRIEPIPVGERQYEEDESSAIIESARRQGQVIWRTGIEKVGSD